MAKLYCSKCKGLLKPDVEVIQERLGYIESDGDFAPSEDIGYSHNDDDDCEDQDIGDDYI